MKKKNELKHCTIKTKTKECSKLINKRSLLLSAYSSLHYLKVFFSPYIQGK